MNCTLRSDIDQDITLIERSGINTISTSAAVSPSPLGQIASVIHLQAGVSTDISIGLGQINLALNRPVTASSGANTATNAVDGNNATAWTSASTQNEWIYVDLGSIFNLTGAQMTWGSSYGQSYNIQVSTDAVNWTNVFETPTGLEALTGLPLPPTAGMSGCWAFKAARPVTLYRNSRFLATSRR